MKKILYIILVIVLAVAIGALAFCTLKGQPVNENVPNPVEPYETLEDARAAAGFAFPVPTAMPEGYAPDGYYVIDGTIAEVDYSNGESEIVYRVAQGNQDISGSYTDYPNADCVIIGNTNVAVKGTEEGINLAIWTSGGLSYSLMFETPVSLQTLTGIIESIQ